MSKLVGKRQLQFQLLEPRAMLAGNVFVSVVDGDLRVDGDDQANVLEIQQLSSSNQRAVRGGLSFRVTPDADTSINRNDPGVGIVVAGVTRDVDVDMGGGGDELALLGANGRQVGKLLIDAGGGPDAVSISRFRLSQDISVSAADALNLAVDQTRASDVSVKIEESESRDAAAASSVTIRNSRLRGNVNVSGDVPLGVKMHGIVVFPDVCKTPAPPAPFVPCGNVNISSGAPLALSIDQTRASDVSVKIEEGESRDAAAASSVTIRNSRLRGNVNVSGDVPLGVKMHGIVVFPDVCKTPAPPAPFVPCGNVNISSGAPLALSIDQTRASDVSVKIDEGKSQDAAAASSVTIRNSRLRGNVNVSGDVPLGVKMHGIVVFPDVCKTPAPPAPFVPCGNVNISSGAPLSLSIDQTRASDVSVKIDEGKSQDAAASSVTIRNSRLRGNVNVSGDVPLGVKMHGIVVFPDVCKTPAPPAPFVPCGNVNISSGAPLALSIDQTRASDVSVKIEEGESLGAAAASSVTIRNSRLRGNVNVSGDVPLGVKMHGIVVFPDVCKTPAPPAPFVPCGNVNISSGAPLSLSIDQTRASDVSVKIDEGKSRDAAAGAASSVTIRNSRLRGNVNVSGDVPLGVKMHGIVVFPDVCKTPAPPAPFVPCGNVNISSGAPLSLSIDQTRASDVSVKIDEGKSQDAAAGAASSVAIRNSRLRGNVDISSGAPLTVSLDQTRAAGHVSINAEGIPKSSDVRSSRFANSIRVVDSVFGSLGIVGSELGDELEFVRLRVLGKSHIEVGGGDDYLKAVDTVFVGFAFLDGGDDNDSLILLRTLFRRGSRLVNWE